MKYDTIKINMKQGVSTIFLNRPNVHNAMNEQLMKELIQCFDQLITDTTTRIIIITGNGKSFCAGADLNWMKSMVHYSLDENIKDSNLLLELYDKIYHCPKPVIAQINGHAFGGGLGLFAACDIAIALPNCKFAFSEAKLGIIPSVISTYIARRINSLSNMRRLFITGERFTSEEALRIGLIDFIETEEKIDELIEKYISILRSSGPKAIEEIKKLIDSYEKLQIEDYKKHTVEKISELRVSDEGQEGINAFLEKRKSKWSE
jgi:methylglutaconyl-CoA hydratase